MTGAAASGGRPPLIGLPGRRTTAAEVAGFAEALGDLAIDMYLADYARGVVAAGGFPVHLPMDVDPAQAIEVLDGLVLTGGCDVAPERYGAERLPTTTWIEEERDELELALLDGAEAAGLPVLGICRGLQLLNVHRGGTLHQHVEAHSRYDVPPSRLMHAVSFEVGSTVAGLYGPRLDVNTLHHQTVDRVGEGLTVTGRAPDGEIEAVELDDRVVAVQWHPEFLATRDIDPLFRWIVDRARRP